MDNTKEQLSVMYMEIAFKRLLEKCNTVKDISDLYGISVPDKINQDEKLKIEKPKWRNRSVCLYGVDSSDLIVDFFSLFPNYVKIFGITMETSEFLSKIDMRDR
jgi:hypothetical protein